MNNSIIDVENIVYKTPYYIVDENLLVSNLKILKYIADKADCHILLAQKAFSMFSAYPKIAEYLNGATASGLFEAKLGYEHFKKENHIFSPAYLDDEFAEITNICDHIIFNSFSQWKKYRELALASGKSFGLRINPEFSTGEHGMYDPCSPYSRMGVTLANFEEDEFGGIDGLHFHTLCEQNSDALEETIAEVERKFSKYFPQLKWINFGGGHHITRKDYCFEKLVSLIKTFKSKYNLTVYLEPGEAIALNTGFLVTTVLDIINNGMDIAIMDVSAACHMPDVLEMPYRPFIIGSGVSSEKKYTYRLGGNTCLAGDIIGDYSFDKPLKVGDKLIFTDMAHYSMVKNNTFNGMALPKILMLKTDGEVVLVKEFGYEDFKGRLS